MSVLLGSINPQSYRRYNTYLGATKSHKRVYYSLKQGLKELYNVNLKDMKVYIKQSATGTNVWYKKDGIVFNFQLGTGNSKTGNMIQTNMYPEEWIKKGEILKDDTKVCFDCPHSKGKNATCYVRKGTSAMGMASKIKSIHKDYNMIGEYNSDVLKVLIVMCSGRPVRFGSYGEPVLMGQSLVEKITDVASTWTGYTHQWHQQKYDWAKKYFMASVETRGQMMTAQLLGWRTFYVNTDASMDKSGLVTCPASKEGGRKTICEDCNLCKGASCKAKSIVINKH
jgi:hypothetical protein